MSVFLVPQQFYNDEKGRTYPKMRLYFYETNTFNFKNVYSDAAKTQLLENPVIADGAGRLPLIYMDVDTEYRVWAKDRRDMPISPYIDNYSPASEDAGQFSVADTFADLRTIEPAFENQVVTLIGHTVAGVGGGTFRAVLDGSGLTDDDGVTAITAGGAAWIRFDFDELTTDMFGIDGAATDKTASLIAFLECPFENKIIKSNDYLIAGAGADSGGVYATISTSMKIVCEDGARFYTDSLDNDLIRLDIDQSLSEAIDFIHWIGGKFDQTLQKNSTSVPFAAEYPPVDVGSSATTDGLSIRMLLNSGADIGCTLLTVTNVKTYGGDHWEIAGGDSGIYAEGAKFMLFMHNECTGSRDLGIYTSATEVAENGSNCVIAQNDFINCFHGAAGKRILEGLTIKENTARNCVRAFICEQVSGFAVKKATIENNITIGCLVTAKSDSASGTTIQNNWAYNSGAFLSNGTSIVTAVDFNFVDLTDSDNAFVNNNQAIGEAAAYISDSRGTAFEIDNSDFATIINNTVDGWYNMGRQVNSPDSTTFVNNTPKNITNISTLQSGGTNLREVRVQSDNTLLNMTPQAFDSSDEDTPMLYRRNQTNVGIYFNLNKVGIGIAGVRRIEATNNGVGFNESTPIAKPTISGVSGNAVLSDLLTQLDAYGLINDTTT